MPKNKYLQRIADMLNTTEGTQSFALFRILFCLMTLSIINEVMFFRPIFFDNIDTMGRNPFPAKLLLAIWTFAVIMVGIGFRTRIFTVLNYFLTITFAAFFTNASIGTFNDDLLRMGSFLMIFMPVSRSFSVDALLGQLRYSAPRPASTPYYHYFFFVFLTLGLLYFGSGMTKCYSDMWTRGLGLWIPSSVPHNHWNELYTLYIDHYWLVVTLNWLVIAFELLFVFILLNRRWHGYLAISGILLHVGIALIFPFPKVCIGPIIFYTLLIPSRFWYWLSAKFTSAEKITVEVNEDSFREALLLRFFRAVDYRHRFIFVPGATLRIDGKEVALQEAATRLFEAYWLLKPFAWLMRLELFRLLLDTIAEEWINHASFAEAAPQQAFMSVKLKRLALSCLVIFLVTMQGVSQAYHIYSYYKAGPQKIVKYFKSRKSMQDFSMKPSNLIRNLFGINSRGVFLDHSNRGVKNTYAITYFDKSGNEVWLPFVDERGFSVGYNMNMNWARYSFNSVCVSTNPADSTELKKYTLLWAAQNHVRLDSVPMNVYRKQCAFPRQFEEGYHQKLRDQPWLLEGQILWKHNRFHYTRLYTDTVFKPVNLQEE